MDTIKPSPIDDDASPVRMLTQSITAIENREKDVRAFVDLQLGAAHATAAELEAMPNDQHAALHGVPVAIKEIIDTAGMICAWGSNAHAGRKPDTDAVIVKALRDAGANVIGTTVSTEYAIASAGPTRNPHNLQLTSGGSSSGSAAAVAAGMVSLAVGTQTIGSIIRPALYCGVPGLKLGHGTVSMDGVMPLQAQLDHVGLIARDWDLIARALKALDLPAPKTLTPGRCYVVSTDAHLSDAVIKARETAQSVIQAAGFQIVEATELSAKRNVLEDMARDLTLAGLAQNHGADFDERPETWSDAAKILLAKGRALNDETINAMHDACKTHRKQANEFIQPGDIILSDAINDTAPMWAPDKTGNNRLQGMWSVLDQPTVAWPIGTDTVTGMPVGVQLSAASGADRWLIDLMKTLQGAIDAGHSSQ